MYNFLNHIYSFRFVYPELKINCIIKILNFLELKIKFYPKMKKDIIGNNLFPKSYVHLSSNHKLEVLIAYCLIKYINVKL